VESKCEGDMVLSFHNALFHDGRLGRPRANIITAGNVSFCEGYDNISHVSSIDSKLLVLTFFHLSSEIYHHICIVFVVFL
jgi:hypothetical protein